MSLAAGRTYLAIPGPSVIPDRVLGAMHRAAPNIYEGELVDMMPALLGDLKRLARTAGEAAIYIANGHGAWEAAVANTLAPEDRVLVLATGRFAAGWGQLAARMGIACDVLDFGRSAPADPDRLRAALAGAEYRAILCTHVDTATSARNDIAALRAARDAAGSEALLMVDCIASLACDRFEMDAWGADVMVAGSQKGLMTPPGLGFVFFNRRASAARARLARVSPYWDWAPRVDPDGFYQYFFGTAPTHHLYGLQAALDMIAEEGLEAVWARHAALAEAIWAAVEGWGPGAVALNIAEPGARSHAVTALRLAAPRAAELRGWTEHRAGLTLGIGLGMEGPDAGAWFRIGHMGHVNAQMILGALGTIEAGLRFLGLAPGQGLAAAAEVVASRA